MQTGAQAIHSLVRRLHAEQSFTGTLTEIRDPFSVRLRRPGQQVPDRQFYRVVDGLAALWTPGQRVSVKGEGGSLVVVGNLDVSLPDALAQHQQAQVGTVIPGRLFAWNSFTAANLTLSVPLLPAVPAGGALVCLLFCSGDPTGWTGLDTAGNSYTLPVPDIGTNPAGPFGVAQSIAGSHTLGPCFVAAFVAQNAKAVRAGDTLTLTGPSPIWQTGVRFYGVTAAGIAFQHGISTTGSSATPNSGLLVAAPAAPVALAIMGAQYDPATDSGTASGRWYQDRPSPNGGIQPWNPLWSGQGMALVSDVALAAEFTYLVATRVQSGPGNSDFELWGYLQNQDGSAAAAAWGALTILLGTSS